MQPEAQDLHEKRDALHRAPPLRLLHDVPCCPHLLRQDDRQGQLQMQITVHPLTEAYACARHQHSSSRCSTLDQYHGFGFVRSELQNGNDCGSISGLLPMVHTHLQHKAVQLRSPYLCVKQLNDLRRGDTRKRSKQKMHPAMRAGYGSTARQVVRACMGLFRF